MIKPYNHLSLPNDRYGVKILLPALNEYPISKAKRWAKWIYHQIQAKISRRGARKRKQILPIDTADYTVQMTFGLWRLIGPPSEGIKSPLQRVLELVMPEIVPTRRGVFRRKFVKLMKLAFEAICDADYDPAMVREMNEWIDNLLSEFTREVGRVKLSFVPLPETAESYSSDRFFEIRSRIWEHFTGRALDRSMYSPEPATPSGGRTGLQMAMNLEYSIRNQIYPDKIL